LIEEGIPIPTTQTVEAQRKTIKEAKLKNLKVKNFLFQPLIEILLKPLWTRALQKQYGAL